MDPLSPEKSHNEGILNSPDSLSPPLQPEDPAVQSAAQQTLHTLYKKLHKLEDLAKAQTKKINTFKKEHPKDTSKIRLFTKKIFVKKYRNEQKDLQIYQNYQNILNKFITETKKDISIQIDSWKKQLTHATGAEKTFLQKKLRKK